MRKYMREVLNAWAAGKPCNRPSASTDGRTVYSYATPILHRAEDGTVTFNATEYSLTTSTQQSACIGYLPKFGVRAVVELPRGASLASMLSAPEGWGAWAHIPTEYLPAYGKGAA